jgi:hypothetical protein
VQNPFAGYRRKFCLNHCVELTAPISQIGEVIAARSNMHLDKLIPMSAVNRPPVQSVRFIAYADRRRADRGTCRFSRVILASRSNRYRRFLTLQAGVYRLSAVLVKRLCGSRYGVTVGATLRSHE